MSTPYVGLRQLHKQADPVMSNPWVVPNAPADVMTLETPSTQLKEEVLSQRPLIEFLDNAVGAETHSRRITKQRLLHLLENHFGVETLQVGLFQMRLTEAVPEKVLLKATHTLLEHYKTEAQPIPAIIDLRDTLLALLRSAQS